MKRFLPILILAAALLTACGEPQEPTIPATEPTPTEATLPPEPTGYYDPGSVLEEISQGALKLYPLSRRESTAIIPFGSDLLLLSGCEGTTLSLLSGNNMYVSSVTNLDCYIDPESPAFRVTEKSITYYDGPKHSLVFLDHALKEVNRVSLPEEAIGDPCISDDRRTIYYCTADALRTIDLETGLDKLLRQMQYSSCQLINTHCGNEVLSCRIEDDHSKKTLFINTQTGQTVQEIDSHIQLWTNEDRYFTIQHDGLYPELLTGVVGQEPALLLQDNLDAEVHPLLGSNALVTISDSDSSLSLEYYDLATGMRTATLQLEHVDNPHSIQATPESNCIWFLGFDSSYESDVLYRWEFLKCPANDPHTYLTGRCTADNPDIAGLEDCTRLANEISERHDVEILLWQDALDHQPWDHSFTPEYQVPVLRHKLQILDNALSYFPADFLKKAAAGTDSRKIRICLVREITGNPDADVPENSLGIQFWDENEDACIALSMSVQMEQTLYHELFHIIESRVLSKSSAYDNWNKLNPEGFDYDYDYVRNLSRQDSPWISGESRAFIDLYSMSFPKEDRARIMEYAMMSGNETCFESDTMQQKLRQLCIGIRKAFRLEKSSEVFRWEQYLQEPLMPA